jgi:tight adherence protein C
MNYISAYVLSGLGTIIVGFWLVIYVKYHNAYDDMLMALDSNQFMLPDIYFIGMGIIDMFHINLSTDRGRKKEKKLAEIYGERYASFYHFCIVGGQITFALTLTPFGLFLGAITNDTLFAVLVIAATIAIVIYLDIQVNSAVEKKRDEILMDYPSVLSKLTLLVNAGMVVREAWNKVAYTSDRAIYREMQTASEEMKNGVSDIDALYNFSQRCAVKEIRKFSSILSQNIQKGGSELAASLKYMNDESWEEKKNTAKRLGELAGQKLMIPLMIMFVGILLMVIIPIFVNMF